MTTVAVIDYGAGNLTSVRKALELTGARVTVTAAAGEIESADALVLPGVGAFGDAAGRLRELGIIPVIARAVNEGKKPFLGICLGFQLLFTESEEEGRHQGFNWLQGRVRRFGGNLKVPHVGWSRVEIAAPNPLLAGVPDGSFFYFVHSYYVDPDDRDYISTRTDYGGQFVSMVRRENIFAMQFHPEKSGDIGQVVLMNFFRYISEGGD